MRYLAIDYGNKRTGLAVCDPAETVVSPLLVLPSNDRLIPEIAKIIADESIESVVVGIPVNMDDTHGPQAKRSADFAAALEKQIDVPIQLHDERLTTFAAEDRLAGAGIPRRKKKEMLDALAAAEILRGFLE
jgi:putative Holliday junction resolvase